MPQASRWMRSMLLTVPSRAFERVEADPLVLEVHPAGEGVLQGLRLLVDLLEHEVLVAALLDLDGIPVQALHRPLGRLAVGVLDSSRARRPSDERRRRSRGRPRPWCRPGAPRGRRRGSPLLRPGPGPAADLGERPRSRPRGSTSRRRRTCPRARRPHERTAASQVVLEQRRDEVRDDLGVGVGGERPALGRSVGA